MPFYAENQKEVNNFHLRNPKPGDYWEEHLSPICIVVDASEFAVSICQTKKEVDDQHWTWDLTKIDTLSHKEFRKKLCYNSEKLKNTTWCDVHPEQHIGFVQEAKRIMHEELNNC